MLTQWSLPSFTQFGKQIGGSWRKNWGELPELTCLGLFAMVPNAAKNTQSGQVTPSHANSRALFLMWAGMPIWAKSKFNANKPKIGLGISGSLIYYIWLMCDQ
jgi:hypothetical protein